MRRSTKILGNVKGILCDIDGTLYYKELPIPGAIEAISELRKTKKRLLFLTNTDSKTPKTIHKKLIGYGFSIEEQEIFTPIIALRNFLIEDRKKKIFLVASREVEEEFKEFNIISEDEIPDYVIISDFSDNWDVNRLNSAFKYLLKGAKLFGTQGNRYCLNHEGEPQIDTGSFVSMLANAASVSFTVFGKPSEFFFIQALNKLSLRPEECLLVGDDFESDILGANNVGIKSVLVKTGKESSAVYSKRMIKPFLTIQTIKSLLEYL